MFSAISNFFAIIKGLLSLWRYWQDFQESQRVIETEKKRVAHQKALEDLQKATTEEEIWDAQKRIVDNKP